VPIAMPFGHSIVALAVKPQMNRAEHG